VYGKRQKVRLQGFNNLSKTLTLNLYDIKYCHETPLWSAYVAHAYNAERLSGLLGETAATIGAEILHVSRQDYDPEGASVAMMIAEEPFHRVAGAWVAHLDKSHITAHTYPERHPDSGICTCRLDIEVSTCGLVSPLTALSPLIESLESPVVTLDYRIRGFTRDTHGGRHFMDHEIDSLQDFMSPLIRGRYRALHRNLPGENLFYTRMMMRRLDPDDYLIDQADRRLPEEDRKTIRGLVQREVREIYEGRAEGQKSVACVERSETRV